MTREPAKTDGDTDLGAGAEVLVRQAADLRHIVGDTEAAAMELISAAESIGNAIENLEGYAEDSTFTEAISDLHAGVTQMIEGCNFQDLTGQRIERVARILERVADGQGAEAENLPFDDELLSGPQTDGGLDQNAVDNLFG